MRACVSYVHRGTVLIGEVDANVCMCACMCVQEAFPTLCVCVSRKVGMHEEAGLDCIYTVYGMLFEQGGWRE